MNECCDWHAVCLNDKEVIENSSQYVSYCAECNSISVCTDGVVKKLDGDQKDMYMTNYKDKINSLMKR